MLLSMVVMARERRTDERIDEAFDRVDADIRELRVEMRQGFDRMQREMTARFDAVQRNMTTWAIALFSATVTLNAAVIAAISLT